MTDRQSLENLLTRFRSGSDRLLALVSTLDDAQLDESLSEGEWTIRQIIHHVADDGDVYSFVLKKAIATPGVFIRMEGFPGNEAWAGALHTGSRPVSAALHLIQAHRESICELLAEFPGKLDQSVTFTDGENGEICFTVEAMVSMLTEHMEEHLKTIEAVLRTTAS